MRMPFELFVALRYLFSRRKQTFIYIISIMSILGVALGVGALVVVLGVYNGLTTDMRDKLLGAHAHAIVMAHTQGAFEHAPDVAERATRDVVSRSSYLEMMAGRGCPEGGVRIDAAHMGAEFVLKNFPGMAERCAQFMVS